MATAKLEHVNISVTDPGRTAELLTKLAGWHVRWEGPNVSGGRSIHCGTEAAYVALSTNPGVRGSFGKGAPLNHLGLQVEDLAVAEEVVVTAGLKPFSHGTYDPGPSSFYFFDWDGIEWEVVSYE